MAGSNRMDLSESLVNTITNSELSSVGSDIGELAIDSLLKDGLLKDIPVIGTLTRLWKTGVTIKDYLFCRKLLVFLSGISDIPAQIRADMISSLEDPKTAEKTGEKLLILLERLESSEKAKLLAKAFKVYSEGTIIKEEFWRISFIVDHLPMSDIQAISEWRTKRLRDVEHIRRHLYLNVGLGWFTIDAGSSGFQWQDRMCTILSEYILCRSAEVAE
jgi:hypothetical protein